MKTFAIKVTRPMMQHVTHCISMAYTQTGLLGCSTGPGAESDIAIALFGIFQECV